MSSWKEQSQRKVIAPGKLQERVALFRRQGKTLATINGSFDLLHTGHLYILFEAAQRADLLIVALNSDVSIKSYKGSDRPLIPLEQRIEMLTALEFVDYVTWFDETDPCKILSTIKPDVHVNGEEYGENCIEAATIKKNGGKLHLVPRIKGLSTSNLLKKMEHASPRAPK